MAEAADLVKPWKICTYIIAFALVGMFSVGLALVVVTAVNGKFQWPIASCSGIYTPFTIIYFPLMSFWCFKTYNFKEDAKKPKRQVISVAIQLGFNLAMVIQHNTWSFMGIGFCASGRMDVCMGDAKTAILALEGVAAFFSLLTMFCIVYMLYYLNCGGRLQILSAIVMHRKGCCSYSYEPLYPEEAEKGQNLG